MRPAVDQRQQQQQLVYRRADFYSVNFFFSFRRCPISAIYCPNSSPCLLHREHKARRHYYSDTFSAIFVFWFPSLGGLGGGSWQHKRQSLAITFKFEMSRFRYWCKKKKKNPTNSAARRNLYRLAAPHKSRPICLFFLLVLAFHPPPIWWTHQNACATWRVEHSSQYISIVYSMQLRQLM